MDKARWHRDPLGTTWQLRAPSGAVLATITYERYRGVFWEAAGRSGGDFHMTRQEAQRAARKALREGEKDVIQ